jgi:hypothetical protein
MIDHLDHLVLTTSREGACIDFCTRVLGMRLENDGAPTTLRRKRHTFARHGSAEKDRRVPQKAPQRSIGWE